MRRVTMPCIRTCVAAALVLTSASLSAQSSEIAGGVRVDACADTTSMMFRDRMLVVLEYDGANRREMWWAIEMAAKRCIVSRDSRSLPDTSVYGRLTINALDSGGYEIATALGGVATQRPECRSKRAAIVSGDRPILWGVILARVVENFMECVARVRQPRSP